MFLIDQLGNSAPLNKKVETSAPFGLSDYSTQNEKYAYIINSDEGNYIYTLLTEIGPGDSIYANTYQIDRSVSIGDFELEDGFVSGSIAEQWSVRYRTNE